MEENSLMMPVDISEHFKIDSKKVTKRMVLLIKYRYYYNHL